MATLALRPSMWLVNSISDSLIGIGVCMVVLLFGRGPALRGTDGIPRRMAAVTSGQLNRERRCFSAAIRPESAEPDGQTAQQADRIAVVLNAREPLSPQVVQHLETAGR